MHFRLHVNNKARGIGDPDMRDAIIVTPPANFRDAAELAKQHIDNAYFRVAPAFKNTVANSFPSVMFGVLHFNAKTIYLDVGKAVRMERWRNDCAALFRDGLEHGQRALFESLRPMIKLACSDILREQHDDPVQNLLKFLRRQDALGQLGRCATPRRAARRCLFDAPFLAFAPGNGSHPEKTAIAPLL